MGNGTDAYRQWTEVFKLVSNVWETKTKRVGITSKLKAVVEQCIQQQSQPTQHKIFVNDTHNKYPISRLFKSFRNIMAQVEGPRLKIGNKSCAGQCMLAVSEVEAHVSHIGALPV